MKTTKELTELAYWIKTFGKEGFKFKRDHYEKLYKSFDVSFKNKVILDWGCGPRGSLVWATEAKLRVGIDILSSSYRMLFGKPDNMIYLRDMSELNIEADIISSFNSLDHTEEPFQILTEFSRVLKLGGDLLIIVELNHKPTKAEPVCLKRDFWKPFFKGWEIVEENYFSLGTDHNIHKAILDNSVSDSGNILKLHLKKVLR